MSREKMACSICGEETEDKMVKCRACILKHYPSHIPAPLEHKPRDTIEAHQQYSDMKLQNPEDENQWIVSDTTYEVEQ